MSDFKLDDDIPLPEPDPSEELVLDDEEDDEDPQVPGKRGRKPRCKSNTLHVWKPWGSHEGHERDKCDLCGDVFPCMNEAKCWHFDCWEARGKIHPWIADGTMVPKEDYGECEKTASDDPGDRDSENTQEIPG